MKVKRCVSNPLIVPQDVKPSRPDFKVDGVFNCGVAEYNDEIILLCRVAESVKCEKDGEVKVPVVVKKDGKDVLDIVSYNIGEHPELDFSDSRTVFMKDGKKKKVLNLTSLSHLRVARSRDGIHFTIGEKPAIWPTAEE
ncbi:MAG: glycosidase, partial [Lachnospiraceae bacterium]|nr:glycosidase [Lachnospiraceae bacterium]